MRRLVLTALLCSLPACTSSEAPPVADAKPATDAVEKTDPAASAAPSADEVQVSIARAAFASVLEGDPAKLEATIPKNIDPELLSEIGKTNELILGDSIKRLRETLEADGHVIEDLRFSRARFEDDGFGPLISGEVYFNSKGKDYYFTLDLVKTDAGPAALGISQWYKPEGE